MANRDGPLGGLEGDAPRLVTHGHGRLREGGDELTHGLVEADLPFFDQREHGGTRDGFRLRRDAEDRVHRHPAIGFLVAPTHRLLVDRLAIAQNQGHRAGQPVFVDVALEHGVDAGQPLGRDTGWRHHRFARCGDSRGRGFLGEGRRHRPQHCEHDEHRTTVHDTSSQSTFVLRHARLTPGGRPIVYTPDRLSSNAVFMSA
jgi:hypothetical protein